MENAHGKPVGKSVGNSTEKPVGISAQKRVGISKFTPQNQQLSKTEWFRYELDFRQTKKGYWVFIRRRLKWSDSRYSKLVVKRFCPQVSKDMVSQIRVGKFSKLTQSALQNGGIGYELISDILARIGKGNGKRRTDLTDLERALLSRIESSLMASNRGGIIKANKPDREGVGIPSGTLPTASDGDFAEVPYVH